VNGPVPDKVGTKPAVCTAVTSVEKLAFAEATSTMFGWGVGSSSLHDVRLNEAATRAERNILFQSEIFFIIVIGLVEY
jgi:hypothetical protein